MLKARMNWIVKNLRWLIIVLAINPVLPLPGFLKKDSKAALFPVPLDISNQLLLPFLLSFHSSRVSHVTSASRQCQSSHVSHENVTQSPNSFQHYSQCLGNFTSLASASPPNPPRRFACLRTRTALHMRLQHCPPISVLTTPYAFTPPPLPSLCSRGALPTCSQHHLSLRSRSALPTCSRHHLSLRLCSALPTSS
ncbi:hypothetical protein O181_099841 [Austropuccinia psidii MF-1]|uniref:Uncharacterized protein n=1 Tax=Austropuccinia psidii MF-1 TaxID=1389203 RepID=A0A9Q3JDL7_9BASI|nr:hypothetical protein [Austropuccinia psidii MF-1]